MSLLLPNGDGTGAVSGAASAVRLFEGSAAGVESVVVRPDGGLILLDKYGYLREADPGPGRSYVPSQRPPLYVGPGRPLGGHVSADGTSVLVCNSLVGLLRVDLATDPARGLVRGRTEILSGSADGRPFHYVNDVDVSPTDGSVYFTSSVDEPVRYNAAAGFYDTLAAYASAALRGDASGALLRYDPATGETQKIIGGLFYANGVAVSHDGSYAAVVETGTHRVLKVHLTGPKKGTATTLIGRIPGSPDGISRSETAPGRFWVAMVAGPNIFLKLTPYVWLREACGPLLLGMLPTLIKKVIPYTGALLVQEGLDSVICPGTTGTAGIVRAVVDPAAKHIGTVSGVTEAGNTLFFGNLGGNFVSYMDLPEKY